MTETVKPGDYIGGIDCGSNAIRFSIFEVRADMTPVPVLNRRFPVRLGAGTFRDGRLAENDIAAAVEAFREMKLLAAKHKTVALPAVATSAIRDAANADELVQRVEVATGIVLRPISGDEEAELVAAGVNATVDTARNRTIFDVGGGSTEIIRCKPDGEVIHKASLPLGAVRLAQEAGMPAVYDNEDLESMRLRIGDTLKQEFPTDEDHDDFGIAIGGTARAVARFGASRGFLEDSHKLTLSGVVASYEALLEMTPEEIETCPGMDRSRSMIIVPGTLILMGVMAFQNLEEAVVSGAGVREGLAIRFLRQT